jgi:pyruvate/2-oxoglutarate dehydrogenase complex dihydrolipoamide dehydrogenase (E3) component/uncharacterized membrane protein YdjX (TVP38/TMEM64 family)
VGAIVFAAVYVLCTVLLIPGSAISIGAGTVFGLKTGLLVALGGANLGALCSFLLARTLLRETVSAWAAANPKFRSLDRAIGRRGFYVVFLTRLSPLFPFVWLNYVLGLTAVRTGAYALANLLGMLPGAFLYVYIGAAAREAITMSPAAAEGFLRHALMVVGLLATTGVVILVTRAARKALREAELDRQGSVVAGTMRFNAPHKPVSFDRMTLTNDAYDRQLIENCRAPGRMNPTPAKKYNLVVLGGGTAGLVSAAGAAGLSAKVALVERNLLGGDCLNVGCVPSKALLRAARAAHAVRSGVAFGVDPVSASEINFSAVMERMRKLRAEISEHDSVARFSNLGVDVFIGTGKFISPRTIEVEGRRLDFRRAVIATGARPKVPLIPGLTETGYFTNETIFTLTELPRRLAVIGAGPIGCELAQAFQRLGSAVTLITDSDEILPREDRDAAEILRRQMQKDGLPIITRANIESADLRDGEKQLTLVVDGKQVNVAADAILIAVGRMPNVENLALDEAGIDYSATGVDVDERLRTSNPRVFAAGDVCSRYKFTHAADAMARIVIANSLFLARRKVTDLVIPWCTYADPEIAHVGYYEKDARAAGYEVKTLTQPFSEVDRAILDGESDGFARVHYDRKTGRIVGGTIVARHAGEMIGELTLAIRTKQSIGMLSSTISSYPTQTEALRKIGDAYMRTKLTPMAKKILAKWLEWRR